MKEEAVVRFPNNFLLTMTDAPPVPPLRSVASYGGTYMVKEIWMPVPEMDGYEASSLGEVRFNGKIVRQYNDNGYRAIYFNKRNKHVHRIVAAAFGLSVENFIDHIDSNRANNNINNLRPATARQNTAWAYGRDPSLSGAYKRPSGLYQARVFLRGRCHSLGNHATAEEAAAAVESFRKLEGAEYEQ